MTRHIDPVITPNGRFMARKSQLAGPAVNGKKKLNGKEYGRELRKLQTELVEMQEWVTRTPSTTSLSQIRDRSY